MEQSLSHSSHNVVEEAVRWIGYLEHNDMRHIGLYRSNAGKIVYYEAMFKRAEKICVVDKTIDLSEGYTSQDELFAFANGIVTISKLIVREELSGSNWFQYTTALEQLTIEGVIGGEKWNFGYPL